MCTIFSQRPQPVSSWQRRPPAAMEAQPQGQGADGDLRIIAASAAQAKQLEERFAETNRRLADSRFVQARRRVADWKADVQTLRATIAQQLDHCKSLRESSTLATMLTEEPSELLRKRSNRMVSQLKADVRELHEAIARHVLSKDREAREAKLEEHDPESFHLGRNVIEQKTKLEERTRRVSRPGAAVAVTHASLIKREAELGWQAARHPLLTLSHARYSLR